MDIKDLIAVAVKSEPLTESEINILCGRMLDADKRFKKEASEKLASREFLDRTYSNIED
jgi:hypothetical protein